MTPGVARPLLRAVWLLAGGAFAIGLPFLGLLVAAETDDYLFVQVFLFLESALLLVAVVLLVDGLYGRLRARISQVDRDWPWWRQDWLLTFLGGFLVSSVALIALIAWFLTTFWRIL